MSYTKPGFRELVLHKYLRRPYRLHVTDHGGNGPVLVLLHGLASSSANWELLLPQLQEQYRCVTIDLIGFGDSPKPQWYAYTMDDHLRNIHAAIRGLHLHGPFTLIGHSLGSLIATHYARLHQRDISRLILLSPPVYAPPGTIASRSARQRTSLYLRAYRFIRTNPHVTVENLQRLNRMIPWVGMVLLDDTTWIPFTRSLEHCIEQQTIIDDIKAVTAPIDIFYGAFDEVVIPYNVRQLAKLRDVTLHPLRVNHVVGKRYANAVAKLLTAET